MCEHRPSHDVRIVVSKARLPMWLTFRELEVEGLLLFVPRGRALQLEPDRMRLAIDAQQRALRYEADYRRAPEVAPALTVLPLLAPQATGLTVAGRF